MERVYTTDPARIFSDYNREVQHIEGYSGRGLLELIQNADDTGLDYDGSVSVLVKLTEEGLFVANTGSTFTREGVSSLMLSDNSPKQFRKECIGYKGLGFRSILNWTSTLYVLSGELSLGFDNRYASEFLNRLRHKSATIDEGVAQYQEQGVSDPIATLSTPRVISRDDISEPRLGRIYETGRDIRAKGYDTVICIPLANESARAQVLDEIDSLFQELTLFLRSVEDFRLQTPDYEAHWEINRDENKVGILKDDGSTESWEIFEETGKIPPEYRDTSQVKDKYEVKIAVPVDRSNLPSSDLFVFFPTKVTFPFPLLAHATFEVTQNRNQLKDTDANRFVAEKLASLMTDAATERISAEDPWSAFDLVTPTNGVGRTLNELGSTGGADTFEGLLRSEISSRRLIPTQDGSFRSPSEVQRTGGNFNKLFDGNRFDDVCRYTSAPKRKAHLDELGVEKIEYRELKARIDAISRELTPAERADFITTLIDADLVTGESPPRLLTDGEKNLIPPETTTFLPPQDEKISLPEWVSQRILDTELATELQEAWNLSSIRDLRQKLRPYKVREYNLTGLIQSVVAEANRRAESSPGEERQWRYKMLRTLWELYQTGEDEVDLSNISIVVPTRTGEFERASSLYFTSKYPGGDLVERLYEPIKPDAFVVEPAELDFCDDVHSLEEFLEWLGVAGEPRIEREKVRDEVFSQHVFESLDYPAEFGDLSLNDVEGGKATRSRLVDVETIDSLEKVLERSDPATVLVWLTTISEKLNDWKQNGDPTAKLKIKPGRRQYWRSLSDQSVPSYPLWLLRTSEWLPVKNGGIQPPATCSTATIAQELSPLIGYPTLDGSEAIFDEFSVNATLLTTTYWKIGVGDSIERLSWEAFYDILRRLPEQDSDGDIAPRVYRKLIASKDDSPPASLSEDFRKRGKMLGEYRGELDYFPVSELRYADSASIPTPIVEKYPLLELDKRRGASKVEDLFGVSELSLANIDLSSVEAGEHGRAEEFERAVERLKPFVYALRVDHDDDQSERRTIQELDVRLCDSVTAIATVDGEKFDITLDDGQFLSNGSDVYVVPEPIDSRILLSDHRLARLIGDVFSEALDVKIGKEILYLATTSARDEGLSVLLGDDSGPKRLREARARLGDEVVPKQQFSVPSTTDAMEARASQSEANRGQGERENGDVSSESTSATRIDDATGSSTVQSVSAEKTELEPVASRQVTIRRSSPLPSKSSSSSSSGGGTSGNDAEEIAYWFEQEQGRFPMLVSNVTGTEGYGCDVISFETEAAKNRFESTSRSDSSPDQSLITRFIEVKRRSSRSKAVELTANELKRAREARKRYYLYRLYQGGGQNDSGELVALRDPLKHDEAVENLVKISPHLADQVNAYFIEVTSERE
jgi:hypothetical protein